jgi:hypothetical protein
MQQAVLQCFPSTRVEYKFINRRPDQKLSRAAFDYFQSSLERELPSIESSHSASRANRAENELKLTIDSTPRTTRALEDLFDVRGTLLAGEKMSILFFLLPRLSLFVAA